MYVILDRQKGIILNDFQGNFKDDVGEVGEELRVGCFLLSTKYGVRLVQHVGLLWITLRNPVVNGYLSSFFCILAAL